MGTLLSPLQIIIKRSSHSSWTKKDPIQTFCFDQSLTIILLNTYSLEQFVSWKLLLYQVMQVSSGLHILYEICQCSSFVCHRSFNVKKEAFQITMFLFLFESPQTKHPQRVHRNKIMKGIAEHLTMQQVFVPILFQTMTVAALTFLSIFFQMKAIHLLATVLNHPSHDFPPFFKMKLQVF